MVFQHAYHCMPTTLVFQLFLRWNSSPATRRCDSKDSKTLWVGLHLCFSFISVVFYMCARLNGRHSANSDYGNLATLALLDLSAVFDTVDHDLMLRRLCVSYGLTGVSLQWFTSYICWDKHIRYAGCSSNQSPVTYGVSQGSVHGSILFIL